jgi:hypothetical protein
MGGGEKALWATASFLWLLGANALFATGKCGSWVLEIARLMRGPLVPVVESPRWLLAGPVESAFDLGVVALTVIPFVRFAVTGSRLALGTGTLLWFAFGYLFTVAVSI